MVPPEGPSSPRSRAPTFYVYILRCADDSYYVGHAEDVYARIALHNAGRAASWTSLRRPVTLAYSEPVGAHSDAIRRERQLKGWSRAKKEALIAGYLVQLKELSRCRLQHEQHR